MVLKTCSTCLYVYLFWMSQVVNLQNLNFDEDAEYGKQIRRRNMYLYYYTGDHRFIFHISVCPSIDVRNTPEGLDRLQNCTVIEGSLQIVLIDYHSDPKFDDKRFPKLREITEYFLMYRVFKLRSLSDMFPNLRVIRGQNLFYNYALAIYEVPDLQELGLFSLTTISRGAVRLEKNDNLCYETTVDWSRIQMQTEAFKDNFFKDNRKDDVDCANFCASNCPTRRDGTELCWTAARCQSGE